MKTHIPPWSRDMEEEPSMVVVVQARSRVWLLATLRPACSPPGSSVHGISQASILEWAAVSSSRGPSWPRDWNHLAGGFFTAEPPVKLHFPRHYLLKLFLLQTQSHFLTSAKRPPAQNLTCDLHLGVNGITVAPKHLVNLVEWSLLTMLFHDACGFFGRVLSGARLICKSSLKLMSMKLHISCLWHSYCSCIWITNDNSYASS